MPGVSAVVEKVATPLPFNVCGEPRFTPPSLNCTVPVGVPAADVTVAVNVTFWPEFDGFGVAETAVAVAALAIVKLCCTFVAALYVPLPACEAVIVQLPAPVM